MTIKEFNKISQLLSSNIDKYEIMKYEITELYNNKKYVTYGVDNLNIELENGIVWMTDLSDIILSGDYIKSFILLSAELTLYKSYFIIKIKNVSLIIKSL